MLYKTGDILKHNITGYVYVVLPQFETSKTKKLSTVLCANVHTQTVSEIYIGFGLAYTNISVVSADIFDTRSSTPPPPSIIYLSFYKAFYVYEVVPMCILPKNYALATKDFVAYIALCDYGEVKKGEIVIQEKGNFVL